MIEKPNMMRDVLTVKNKFFVTPHYIRVILESDQMDLFQEANIGDNNKLVIPMDKTKPLQLPDGPPKGGVSDFYIRTYTLRAIDFEKSEMTVDFVMHGETGPASKWAINAQPGDQLGVLMKAKRKPLFQEADWYLLVGDHTALPVISAILEQLPSNAQGQVVLEVPEPEDVLELEKPEHIQIHWVFNPTPGENSQLVSVMKEIPLDVYPNKFVYAAAEYHIVKEMQDLLRQEQSLERKDWYAFSYWKYGVAEDGSAQDRRGLTKN
ncbi:siderophore-interacting protein [Formosa sp. S-31]|uniref:siderophore-interacting protein n=1 Tax=Formosa sp. S-31 TaxID=2790949 RepID=UPI003EBFD4C6